MYIVHNDAREQLYFTNKSQWNNLWFKLKTFVYLKCLNVHLPLYYGRVINRHEYDVAATQGQIVALQRARMILLLYVLIHTFELLFVSFWPPGFKDYTITIARYH